MLYLWVKSLHIIFVVSWFAGLFYVVRLYIYFVEAKDQPAPAKEVLQRQLGIMAHRLWYYITWPAMLLTVFFGVWMILLAPALLHPSWMHIKLLGVAFLLGYHFHLGHMLCQIKKDSFLWTSKQLRIYNEVATILLFLIVFAVVLKNSVHVFWGMLGLAAVALVLVGTIQQVLKRKKVKN